MNACSEKLGTKPKVYRFTDKKGNPRYSVRLTFDSEELRNKAVTMGLNLDTRHFRIREYIERRVVKPLRCQKCWRMGHWTPWCKHEEACSQCGESVSTHTANPCQAEAKCVNCPNPAIRHSSNSETCPVYTAIQNSYKHG